MPAWPAAFDLKLLIIVGSGDLAMLLVKER